LGLATILEAKFGQHLPLNRQSETFAREGIELDVSTMADWVGACTATLAPLTALIRAHVLAGERIHGDDTTVPVLAKGKTSTGRLWTYVRDDRPFGGPAPPAAVFHYSPDRRGEHPQKHLLAYAGILQADAYAGFQDLYHPRRKPGPVTEAGCWAHGRRKLFELAQLARAPLAAEAVRRIDAIFDAERTINGLPTDQRLAVRQKHIAPLVAGLEIWMRAARAKMSRHADVAKAMDYMLKRWDSFSQFTTDGRICLTNNAAERALRGVALGRKSWLFCGSDRGGDRAAAMYSLIVTAKLNDTDPRAWLADVLRRINDHPASRLYELLPWNWHKPSQDIAVAAWANATAALAGWIPLLRGSHCGYWVGPLMARQSQPRTRLKAPRPPAYRRAGPSPAAPTALRAGSLARHRSLRCTATAPAPPSRPPRRRPGATSCPPGQ